MAALPRGVEAAVEIDGRQDRFHGIGKNRVAPLTTGLALAFTQPQVRPQIEATRQRTQRRLAHQTGPQTRQRPLVVSGILQIQRLADQRVEQSVTQKLEALVVDAAHRAMRQGLHQPLRVDEPIPQARLQAVECRQGIGPANGTSSPNSSTSDTLANRWRRAS